MMEENNRPAAGLPRRIRVDRYPWKVKHLSPKTGKWSEIASGVDKLSALYVANEFQQRIRGEIRLKIVSPEGEEIELT